MILVPEEPKVDLLVKQHFLSALQDGHHTYAINCESEAKIYEALQSIGAKPCNHTKEKIVYSYGFDVFSKASAITLSYLISKFFREADGWQVRFIPVIEEPDVVKYIYKQSIEPTISYLYNSEPFISYGEDEAEIYYNSVCTPSCFSSGDYFVRTNKLVERYGDFWGIKESAYERARINNIRLMLKTEKSILSVIEIGSYLRYLSDNLELNGYKVIKADILPAILKLYPDTINISSVTIADLTNYFKQTHCVLFASILFAYTENSTEIANVLNALRLAKTEYILYEDSKLNYFGGSNRWLEFFGRLGYNIIASDFSLGEAVEKLYGKKNIKRYGSRIYLLKHYDAPSH